MAKKVLLIVEGEVTEVELFSQINKLFFDSGTKLEFFPYRTNIYSLYNLIKSYEGWTDTVAVLKTLTNDIRKKELLDNNFAEIYLIFDAEFQDPAFKFEKIRDMLAMFDDETELGKLYINYPMVESYRDHKYYLVNDYFDRDVKINILNSKNYKSLVRTRGYTKKIHKYTATDFNKTCLLNVLKAGYLVKKRQDKMSYEEYRHNISQNAILDVEEEFVKKRKKVSVLNTCVFFLVDYFGRKFYDVL